MTGRDPYANVGQALRKSVDRALAADLTGRDWKVLSALFREITSWSRLSDRVHAARLAELTGMDERAVRRSVGRLVEVGAIWREPSLGRYPSKYGLPWSSATSIDPADPGRERPVSEHPTLVVDDPPTLVADDHPAEKPAEKSSGGTRVRASAGAREAAAQGEPSERQDGETFGKLMAGVGLSGRKLAEMHDAFKAEPARVTACVEEWWRRKDRKADTGPGPLVRMVEDGDHPGQNGRRPRRTPSPVCAECELSPPHHAADCSLAGRSA